MRKAIFLLIVLLLATGVVFAQDAVVDRVSGKVEVRIGGGPWEPVGVGDVLPLNATISTGFGASAVLNLGSSVLEVQQLTRLTIQELADDGLSADVFVPVGRVRARVNATAGRQADFRVRTPLSTASVRGTDFETNGWQVSVAEGVVEFANLLNEQQNVGPGQTSTLADGSPSDPASDADKNADIGDDRGPGDFEGGLTSSGWITVRWGF
jgi:hypothetical protein